MPVLAHQQGELLLGLLMRFWPCSYDINVTPDKRKSFLHHEDELLSALQEVPLDDGTTYTWRHGVLAGATVLT